MIGRLKGVIAAVGEGQALIDVGGVGYLVHAGSRTLARLVAGEAAELHVETQMSESAIRLYGFVSGEERAWFARLQDAPGVGAKLALACRN
jgi:Holliday junction DNA helicase RuvA